jgi:phenylacetate-CoA ligase
VIGELIALRAALRAPYRSRDEVVARRDARLRALVRHAWERVPYYRALLDAAGVRPADVRSAADLVHVPISTKEDFRTGLARLAQGVDAGRCRSLTTSGSTGEPLTTILSSDDVRARDVVRFRTLLGLGFRPRDHMAIVGPIEPRRARAHERLGLFRGQVVPLSLPLAEQVRLLRALDPTVLTTLRLLAGARCRGPLPVLPL